MPFLTQYYYYVAVQRPATRSMKPAHSTSVLDIGSVISKDYLTIKQIHCMSLNGIINVGTLKASNRAIKSNIESQ